MIGPFPQGGMEMTPDAGKADVIMRHTLPLPVRRNRSSAWPREACDLRQTLTDEMSVGLACVRVISMPALCKCRS